MLGLAETILKLTPIEARTAGDIGLETSSRRGLRNPSVTQVVGIAPVIHTADLRTTTENGVALAPIHVEVSLMLDEAPWNTMPLAEIESFVGSLEIEPYLWLRSRERSDSTSIEYIPMRAARPVASPIRQNGDTLSVAIELPLERPAQLSRTDRDVYLYLAAKPTETLSRNLIPESFSTNDDRSPAMCSQVLKLERLIGVDYANKLCAGSGAHKTQLELTCYFPPYFSSLLPSSSGAFSFLSSALASSRVGVLTPPL